MNSKIVKIAVAILALAAAGYFAWGQHKAATEDDGRNVTTAFLCEDCKNVFEMTQWEIQAVSSKGRELACPKCGKSNLSHVFKCPNCNEALYPVGHSSVPKICPHCKKPTS